VQLYWTVQRIASIRGYCSSNPSGVNSSGAGSLSMAGVEAMEKR